MPIILYFVPKSNLIKQNKESNHEEVIKMFFLTYFELNNNVDPTIIADLAQKFMSKKLFPVEGVKITSWLLTPENWGIVI